MKDYQIVLSRYKENIDWANGFKNVLVYNKGPELQSDHPVINLVNIGHEAHTYLTYVVNYYHSLPDVVCFFQANPHIQKLIGEDLSEDKLISYFVDLKNAGSENYEIQPLGFCLSSGNEDPNWNYRIFEYPFGTRLSLYHQNALDWFRSKINREVDVNRLRIYFGANFSVRKEAILSRSLDFYRDLLVDFKDVHCEYAHFCERGWYYIFNLDKFE